MPPTSTTAEENSNNSDATSTTTTTPPAPDTKPADSGDNLDASQSADSSAAGDDTKSTTTSTKSDDTPVSSFDEDLNDWAEKRKMPKATTDDERQAYQDLRNSQREFTKSRQQNQAANDAKDLSKEIDGAKKDVQSDEEDDELDPLEKRVNAVDEQLRAERTTRLQSEFYVENKVTAEEHKMLLDVMKEKFNRPATNEGKRKAIDQWAHPDALPDLLDIARARIAKTVDTSSIEDEAARKERERIARESQAKSPNRSAQTSPTPGDKTEDQARLERFKARYNK